ncbi:MAG: hypothetical protein ILP11_01275 [Alphaproteobacteria bacterium]|nr:hypothetical protein [Alphaproteobacteria bacterium]
MSRRNICYGKPEKIYKAEDIICLYCDHQPLSKEELDKYTGAIVLTYPDKSRAYTKVKGGVVNGVFVLYENSNMVVSVMRGRFEEGDAEGPWRFHRRIKGVWVDVEVEYHRGKVVKDPKVEPANAISLLKMKEFRAPNLKKTMAFKIPLRTQAHWTRPVYQDIENTHE